MCEGVASVNVYKGWNHNGLVMLTEGYIQTVVPNTGIAVNSEAAEKQTIFCEEYELAPKGYFNSGVVEFPFKFKVATGSNSRVSMIESYHGVYISVIYHIYVSCDRGMMKKSLKKDLEFVVEIPQAPEEGGGISFNISPSRLMNIDPKILRSIPNFEINGKVHRTHCNINQPFTGEVTVDMSVATIKSLELQLVRVESIDPKGTGEYFREATEIQLLQIGEGNVCRGLVVPMYMVFPRLFSCPTVNQSRFKIEFEINLLCCFGDGHLVTENLPITIGRFD
jgi:hypothetical protein